MEAAASGGENPPDSRTTCRWGEGCFVLSVLHPTSRDWLATDTQKILELKILFVSSGNTQPDLTKPTHN